MTSTQGTPWRAGRFGSSCGAARPMTARSLGALVFDLDALTDVECDGHRVAYNAAFAAHHLDFQWSPMRYRQLLALGDERQRVNAELRRRGIATECDVLMKVLSDDVYTTKTMMFDELVADANLAPRPGLVELVAEAAAAGVPLGVVTTGQRSWAEPLVRRLVGDAASLVTATDVMRPMPNSEAVDHALSELGVSAENALAFSGSARGLRATNAAGVATVVITGEGVPTIPAAIAVRPDFGGRDPLGLADCQRLHGNWYKTHKPSAA